MPDQNAASTPLLEEQLTRYRSQVERHVRAMVRDPSAAEELTQETFVRALAAIDSLRDPQATLGWLYRIATNVCLDHLRRRRPAALPMEPGSAAEQKAAAAAGKERPPALIESAMARAEMSECVQRYLETLRDDYRVALLLHDVYGVSNPEIAELVGCSPATAKIRVHRARRRLRETLASACDFSLDERGVLVCEPQADEGSGAERPV